jgi:cephalosporin-C deacetylase-like acetyl esterase
MGPERAQQSPAIPLAGYHGRRAIAALQKRRFRGKTNGGLCLVFQPGHNRRPAGYQSEIAGLVLIHGGGGKAFREWVEKWANEGYAAIAMDLSGNGPDGQKVEQPGPEQSNENKFQRIEKGNLKNVWTYHAVASSILAHSLLLSFPEIDPLRTGVTGISWGGYLTCLVASLDNRFIRRRPGLRMRFL